MGAAGDSMEPVLRSVELATSLTNNTDLGALLASRLDGEHLPQPDLSAPHPFRGSAPGVKHARLPPGVCCLPLRRLSGVHCAPLRCSAGACVVCYCGRGL